MPKLSMELPPRTRRILRTEPLKMGLHGTTSAYAENTPPRRIIRVQRRNYLRVRGEYPHRGFLLTLSQELPPRTRRIPDHIGSRLKGSGTTSAYAENTHPHSLTTPHTWNYLRVRGEYDAATYGDDFGTELPPRTRRIHIRNPPHARPWGTTSAYAENTSGAKDSQAKSWNYLRVRGEYEDAAEEKEI